jgi:hypothetical protein
MTGFGQTAFDWYTAGGGTTRREQRGSVLCGMDFLAT